MAGSGVRFGSQIPKQFHRLAGKKIYLHTLEAFLQTHLFHEIVLVCAPSMIAEIRSDLNSYSELPITVIEGGNTRQESSYKGLLACGADTECVVIHDAVRPFVSFEIIKHNIEQAIHNHAVDTCIPSADTLVYAPDATQIAEIPRRADYLRGQTPQSFAYPLILKAHHRAIQDGITASSDDCSLVLRLGHPVKIILGNEENIKITSELDLFLAEQMLRLRQHTLTDISEQNSLKGKIIAITGGTGGIGSELCRQLEQAGATVLLLSRSSDKYSADLTSFNQTRILFDKILQEHGPLDGLVNSIGLLKTKQLEQLSYEEIDTLIQTNLSSVIYSCKCAHLKKGAHIVNIASSSYARGRKNYAIYTGAKAAVVNFTQGLSEERPELFINALIPQRTLTPMRLDNFPDENPESLLNPNDVAKEILLLLKQRYLTGTLIEVRKK